MCDGEHCSSVCTCRIKSALHNYARKENARWILQINPGSEHVNYIHYNTTNTIRRGRDPHPRGDFWLPTFHRHLARQRASRVNWRFLAPRNTPASSSAAMARKEEAFHPGAPLTQRTHQVRHCTPRNRTGWYPRRSRVCPLVSPPLRLPPWPFVGRGPTPTVGSTDSFHPRTKSRIVTRVVSQLGQSYLIKSSRGRPGLFPPLLGARPFASPSRES